MPLQDLTPQLRTRLNRMERAVGWFVLVATFLLLFGFGYYIYTAAESRGWFKIKARFYTYANSGTGLNVGEPIKLMGFPAGTITEITAMPAWGGGSENRVYIGFEVTEPYYGYLWTAGSYANLGAADLLGKRELDLTRGTNGYALVLTREFKQLTPDDAAALPDLTNWSLGQAVYSGTNRAFRPWQHLSADMIQQIAALGITNIPVIHRDTEKGYLTALWNAQAESYQPYDRKHSKAFLQQIEAPSLTDQAQQLVAEVEVALPRFLAFTNQLTTVLSNSARLTSNLNLITETALPAVTNLATITANLREPRGSLGEWAIPTNISLELQTTLQNASLTMTNANTNLAALSGQIGITLTNLANTTSNLNHQVEMNTNMLTQISDLVVHSDQFIQGLKRFWLLRSAFRTHKTNSVPAKVHGQ
jgi:ABC-type transporter Mla subunit MlaD